MTQAALLIPPAGFRLARIHDTRELEAGSYWPRLQPHFLKPEFRLLRYRIQERETAPARNGPGPVAAIRGASGLGGLDIACIADRLAATMTIAGPGFPDYCLTSVGRGALAYSDPVRTRTPIGIGPDLGLIYRGVAGSRMEATRNHERLAIWIPSGALHQRLAALLDGPVTRELAFEPVFAWDTVPGQGLKRLVQTLVQELGSPMPFGRSELAMHAFTDLLLYTLLRAVPHNHTEQLARAASPAIPRNIRRAEAFIRAHAEAPISLQDVAEAAGCSVRSLQLGFQRFRDTTPLGAIRAARLQAAREAVHTDAQVGTVAELALRFGFTHPGRFSRMFQAAFGESPAEALARRGDRRA